MRRDIGRRLVLDAVEIARERSFDRLGVATNPRAAAFYESMGFIVEGMVDTRFYPAPRMYRSTSCALLAV